MPRLVQWIIFTSAIFGALIFAARVGGSLIQPPSIAARIFDLASCPQPCWHGIRPGSTSLEEAETLLRADPELIATVNRTQLTGFEHSEWEMCWTIRDKTLWMGCAARRRPTTLGVARSGPITGVMIMPPWGILRLGDVVRMFGTPETASTCLRATRRGRLQLASEVYFFGNIEVRAYSLQRTRRAQLDPNMVVSVVRFHYPDTEPPYSFEMPDWRGFTSRLSSRYC